MNRIRMNIAKFGLVLLHLFLLSCKSGQDYKRPELDFVNNAKQENISKQENWWLEIKDFRLKTIIEKSLEENFDVSAQKARIEKYQARLGIAKNALIPNSEIGASATSRRTSLKGLQGLNPFVARNYRQYDISASFSWQIDLFGSVQRQIESAIALLEGQDQKLQEIQNATAKQIVNEYVILAKLNGQIEIIKEQIRDEEKDVSLQQDLFNSGISSKSALNRALIELQKTKTQIPMIEFQIEEAMARIDILCAKEVGYLKAKLKNKKIKIPNLTNFAKKKISSQILLNNNPEILQKEQELIAANARIGAVKAEYFPKFTFSGDFGLQSINNKDIFSKKAQTFMVGPFISWRIFDFMKIEDEIKQAKAEQKEFLENYKKTVLEKIAKIEIATIKIQKTKEELELKKAELLVRKNNISLLKSEYEAGLIAYFELITSKSDLRNLEIMILDSEADYQLAVLGFVGVVY